MKKLILLGCLLLCVISLAQNHSYVQTISQQDSLKIVEYRTKLAQHVNLSPDSAFFYGQKIKSLANDLNYGIGIADADYLLGSCFRRVQKNDSAIFYYKKSLNLSKKLDYSNGKARAHNSLGRTYYLTGKIDSSIAQSKKAIKSVPKDDPTSLLILADSHIAIATGYSRKNEIKKAISHLIKVDSIHQKNKLRPDVIAASYQNLGNIYLELEEYPSAITYFLKANTEFKNLPKGVSEFYLNTTNVYLGFAYLNKGSLKKADTLLTNSYIYFNKIKDSRLVAEIANYRGQLALQEDNSLKAESFFKESFKINNDNKNYLEAIEVALEIAKLELYKTQPKNALIYLAEAEKLNKLTKNSKIKQEILFHKAQANSQSGNYKQAYKYEKHAKKIQDSLQKVQSVEKIKEIEAKYQTEKRDREIELLTSKNKLSEQQKANQRNLFIAAITVTGLAAVFFFFQYRNRQKTTKKLKELDAAKSTFFSNISHEFRTPITLIKGPIEDQLASKNLENKDRKNLLIAQKNTSTLEALVDQLLVLSKLESGYLKLQVQPGNLTAFLKNQAEAFRFITSEKHITYTVDLPENNDTEEWFDDDAFQKITTNLIGNAVKYTTEKGTIKLSGKRENNQYLFKVFNSGTHINPAQQKQLFERFYQTSNQNTGSGIGLALTKELVELHKGSITVHSNENEGTTFSISIPIDKDSYNDTEIASEIIKITTTENEINDAISSSTVFNDADTPILLIVDDSADIITYLTSIFESTFNVHTAHNGEEGYNKTVDLIPDIIISDIMMPGMDGYDFTHKIKNNPLTSHIPITLLTAKTEEPDKLKGIEKGADAYLLKPFNSKILQATIHNLLENRRKLQERFSSEVILRPQEISVTSADEQFLNNLQEVLDKHLTDSTFTATEFCNAMAVSRMQLHRKLKALTGQSTTEFLRSQRLKAAAILLKEDKISISEVGYNVGFNDPSYFTKCFKQEYGITPTEFSAINS